MKPKSQVEYRKLSELKELPGNPRTIKKDQFEKLKKSLKDNKDYFEARPIILSDRTGELVILAGNQRYKAAQAIGMNEVPTILLKGLTEQREKEIIIRDNVNNGEWDSDILANNWEIEELAEWGAPVPVMKEKDEEGEVQFAEFIDEENNYILLKFTTDIDWINACSIFDIKPGQCYSTRRDGVITDSMHRIGVARVIDGAEALRRITK